MQTRKGIETKVGNTILIVDDQLSARETLRGFLLQDGYNLVFAASGEEALGRLDMDELAPDTILLDVMMPGMDGFEVCQRLKANEQWRCIPVILVTALDRAEDLVLGFDAGADDFVSKPVNRQELQARVRSMLRIKAQYDDLQKRRRELEASLHLNRKYAQVLAQQLEALEFLHQAGLRLMKGTLTTDSVLNLISQTVLDLIPEASGCAVHFLAGEGQQLLPIVFPAEGHTKMIYPSLGIEEIVSQVIESGKDVYIPDVAAEPYRLQPEISTMRSLLMTPWQDEQRALGTLTVYSSEANVFEQAHQHSLSILAAQAAAAITKAQFLEEKERAKEREKWAIRDIFRRYVSPLVVERLVDGTEDLGLGGKRQEISVLFADVRGFTTFGENLSPEYLVEVLNKYLALAVEVILAEEGTLDKFMGDAVMAFFNAPLSQPDHTLKAVKAALAMQRDIARYNSAVVKHHPLSFGIGIHVGEAVVGNIGTAEQMNYTAIGDTVNLAKRLQENARGGQIILSQSAYEAVKEDVTAEDLGPLIVKGRTETIYAYDLVGLV